MNEMPCSAAAQTNDLHCYPSFSSFLKDEEQGKERGISLSTVKLRRNQSTTTISLHTQHALDRWSLDNHSEIITNAFWLRQCHLIEHSNVTNIYDTFSQWKLRMSQSWQKNMTLNPVAYPDIVRSQQRQEGKEWGNNFLMGSLAVSQVESSSHVD